MWDNTRKSIKRSTYWKWSYIYLHCVWKSPEILLWKSHIFCKVYLSTGIHVQGWSKRPLGLSCLLSLCHLHTPSLHLSHPFSIHLQPPCLWLICFLVIHFCLVQHIESVWMKIFKTVHFILHFLRMVGISPSGILTNITAATHYQNPFIFIEAVRV